MKIDNSCSIVEFQYNPAAECNIKELSYISNGNIETTEYGICLKYSCEDKFTNEVKIIIIEKAGF